MEPRFKTKTALFLAAVLLLPAASACSGSLDAAGDDDSAAEPDATPSGPDGGGGSIDPNNPACGELEATIRDFQVAHSDFEEPDGNSDVSVAGLVQSQLGADGTPVYAPPGPVEPHTSGPGPFADWYHDVPGVNQRFAHTITLTDNGQGVDVFSSDAFFPIDGLGFGNEGLPHNFHFTTEVHTAFQYKGGETFRFTGDDDLWLFINGRLAIDLGGLHPSLSAEVNLDAKAVELGISPSGTYKMDIFHAERHGVASNFRIETTIDCFIVE